VKRNDKTGQIEGVEKRNKNEAKLESEPAPNKKARKLKRKTAEKKKQRLEVFKEKKQAKKAGKFDEFARFKDEVKFGEIVHEPPKLLTLPRRAQAVDKVSCSQNYAKLYLINTICSRENATCCSKECCRRGCKCKSRKCQFSTELFNQTHQVK
jgi:hypothetical protein